MRPSRRPVYPYAGEVLNQAALDRMGILVGTSLDGCLVMTETDHQKALSAGAISSSPSTTDPYPLDKDTPKLLQ